MSLCGPVKTYSHGISMPNPPPRLTAFPYLLLLFYYVTVRKMYYSLPYVFGIVQFALWWFVLSIKQFKCTSKTCLGQFWLKGHLIPSMEPLKWRNIHDLYTTDTSLIRTLCSVPSVSVLERFYCSCFSIYHKSWITSGPKSNFIFDNIPTKAILFFFGCSEVISQVLFTSEQLKKNKMTFVGILSPIKLLFGPLVIHLVWYLLKQLFTSVSVKVVDIYLAASQLCKYPPLLFTSTSVNNC